jgi:tellurite resistance protein
MKNSINAKKKGIHSMTISDQAKNEMNAYQKGLLENPTIQDALTIMAVYAAQIDPEDCEKDINRIGTILENHPDFDEKRKEILSRVNYYVNSIEAVDLKQAVEIAMNVLKDPALNKSAFALAAKVALPDNILTDDRKDILEKIAAGLYLDDDFVQQALGKVTK